MLKLLRPSNWTKNFLVALPLILSAQFSLHNILFVSFAILSFSLIASGGYILNDIRDLEKDRQHIHKRNRPLANGSTNIDRSFFLALFLILFTLLINYFIAGLSAFLIILFYFSLNYYYSIHGKKVRLLDILILSTFYIIRVIYGANLTNTPLTGWFMSSLVFAVLSLSFNKRYLELKISESIIPGRGYSKNDEQLLQSLMINFALGSIIFVNIHAFFVLKIISPYFYSAINLCASGIVFLYFDTSKRTSDDPVEIITGNKLIILLLVIFFTLYLFEMSVQFRGFSFTQMLN